MHDIPEGIERYDIALIISGLVEHKYFSKSQLNSRILMFNYGMMKKINSSPTIRDTDLDKGCIIMSFSEMLCLIH